MSTSTSSFLNLLWSWQALEVAVGVWLLYLIAGGIYRLYFSPIAQFPGPKLAALTLWYEFYWDVIKGGQWTFHIGDLHEKYGPVVRINPYELHISPPTMYEKLYAGSSRKRNKYAWFTAQIGIPDSLFATIDHDLHRIRRAAMNPFFSMTAVRRLQPIIDNTVDAFLGRFKEFGSTGEVMTVNLAMAAFTNDIAMEYAFARSDHRVKAPDFDPSFHDAAMGGSTVGGVTKQFTFIVPMMQSLPDSVVTYLDPNMGSYIRLQNDCRAQVESIRRGANDGWKGASHPTIFHELLNSDLPESEKSSARLGQDGQLTVVAGTLTTAWSLSVGFYYILADPRILRTVKNELEAAFPDPDAHMSILAVEQLTYLHACVQEALRLSYGASSRLPRICTEEELEVPDKARDGKVWSIPRGTPCSMTSTLLHHDESVFPDSHTFSPERWLKKSSKGEVEREIGLERFLVSFSKGSRQCIGINLAYAELYLLFARLFRVYGSESVRGKGDVGRLEFFETDVDDVRIFGDYFVPLPKRGSKGIRIKVVNFEEEKEKK